MTYVLFDNFIYKISGVLRFSTDPFYWSQKMILNTNIDFITDISIENSSSKFNFRNVNDTFFMNSNKIKINKEKAYSILNSFSDLYAENTVHPKIEPSKGKKSIKVSLTLIDGVIINITIFQKGHLIYMNIDEVKKGYSLLFDSYMTRFTENWTYIIPNLVFENLSVNKEDFFD